MNDAAIKTFPTKKQKTVNTKNHWFGPACKRYRKIYHSHRRNYKTNKSIRNKNDLNKASKEYKKTMNFFINKYKKETANKLRKMSTCEPKRY